MEKIFESDSVDNMYKYGLKYFREHFDNSIFEVSKKIVKDNGSSINDSKFINKTVFEIYHKISDSVIIGVLKQNKLFVDNSAFYEFVKQMKFFLAESYFLLSYVVVSLDSSLKRLYSLSKNLDYYKKYQREYVVSLAGYWLTQKFSLGLSNSVEYEGITQNISEIDKLELSINLVNEWYVKLKSVS